MNKIYEYPANTPLAAGQVFNSSFFPIGPLSGQSVRIACYSDQPGMLVLYQTDGLHFPDQFFEVARVQTSGGVFAKLEYGVTANFWKFVYTNGATAQTTFSLIAEASNDVQAAILVELRKINGQLLAMRSQDDSSKDDFSQI